MSERSLRVGIVGAGRMGMVHATLLATFPDVSVAAIADPATTLRSQFESQGLRCPFVPSVAEMLRVGVDAAYICTPNSLHAPLVEECAKAGVHVFVEKPLADTLENAERMVKLVQENPVTHAVGFVYGYLPIFRHVRELLREGAVGTVQRGRAHCYISEVFGPREGWYYDRAKSGGGVLPNLGSHLFYLLALYFGEVREVQGKVLSQFSAVDDSASAIMTFEGDVPVLVDVSWSVPGAEMLELGVTIEGSGGLLIASKEEVLLHRYEGTERFAEGWSRIHLSDLDGEIDFDISPHIGGEGFFFQARDFIDSCLNGSRPKASFFEGLNVQRMMHGIYQSDASGAPARFV